MAAVVCLAPQAQADPAPAHAAAQPAAVTQAATVADALSHSGMSPAELFSALRVSAPAAPAASYTVRSGDSLSKIAGKVYHKQGAWPVLYWANRNKVHWANMLGEGQVLKVPALPAKIPPRRPSSDRLRPRWRPRPCRAPRPRPRRPRPRAVTRAVTRVAAGSPPA